MIDHWWQTETAWSISGNWWAWDCCRSNPARRHVPLPGYDVQVVDALRIPWRLGRWDPSW